MNAQIGTTLHLTVAERDALATVLGRIADQTADEPITEIYDLLMDNGAVDGGSYEVLTVDLAGNESDDRQEFVWVLR